MSHRLMRLWEPIRARLHRLTAPPPAPHEHGLIFLIAEAAAERESGRKFATLALHAKYQWWLEAHHLLTLIDHYRAGGHEAFVRDSYERAGRQLLQKFTDATAARRQSNHNPVTR